jgi:hypothetical protein
MAATMSVPLSRDPPGDTTFALVPQPGSMSGSEIQGAQVEGDKNSLDEKNQEENGDLDYEKMQRQQIGVTRIETLWRHFGNNKPVLTALGTSIFRM